MIFSRTRAGPPVRPLAPRVLLPDYPDRAFVKSYFAVAASKCTNTHWAHLT